MAHLKLPLSLFYSLSLITLLISSTVSKATPTAPISKSPSYYYNLCAHSRCGNLSLSYPFNLPTPCHPSHFQPFCPTNQSLLLTSPESTDTFRVLSMKFDDPSSITITIASDALFTCGLQLTSPDYANYATIFVLPSKYTPGTLLNCTSPVKSTSLKRLQNASCIGCSGQDSSNFCYYARDYIDAPPNCELYRMFTLEDSFNASSIRDMRAYLQSGFELKYAKPLECRGCEASGGRCGASPSTGSFVCFCPSTVHPTNCTDGMLETLSTSMNEPGRGESGPSRAVIAAVSASASVLIAGVLIALGVITVRRRKHNILFGKETISGISLKRYSYSQLKEFTNNFSSKLGEGGSGSVYKGIIRRSRAEVLVAVKILRKSEQTKKQFMNEIATIGSVHHHNLVSMLGYCVEGDTHALVYEYMENGSLEMYIYNKKREKDGGDDGRGAEYRLLSRKEIHNIALETGRGILYLHQGCRSKILHCDIKPSNVLLDSNFSAKLADFGLSKMINKDHSHVSLTAAQGTPGYAAPEMWMKNFGPVTEKSDVYSYGMLLLEMVGRRKNYDVKASGSGQVYFPEWLYSKVEKDEFRVLMREENGDDSFEIFAHEEDEMGVQRMCLVGLWCIQHVPANRPSMDRVVQMLDGHVEIGIPPYPFPQNQTRTHERESQDGLV